MVTTIAVCIGWSLLRRCRYVKTQFKMFEKCENVPMCQFQTALKTEKVNFSWYLWLPKSTLRRALVQSDLEIISPNQEILGSSRSTQKKCWQGKS